MCTPGMWERWNAALGRLETRHLQDAGRPVSGRLGRTTASHSGADRSTQGVRPCSLQVGRSASCAWLPAE